MTEVKAKKISLCQFWRGDLGEKSLLGYDFPNINVNIPK